MKYEIILHYFQDPVSYIASNFSLTMSLAEKCLCVTLSPFILAPFHCCFPSCVAQPQCRMADKILSFLFHAQCYGLIKAGPFEHVHERLFKCPPNLNTLLIVWSYFTACMCYILQSFMQYILYIRS